MHIVKHGTVISVVAAVDDMKQILLLLLVVFSVTGCSGTAVPPDPIPKHDTFTIESGLMGETRTICVWTPPGDSDSLTELPVLYMPDGGINEDFPHIANTISELVKSEAIPPMLLVGIENTERRRDLTGPSKVSADQKIAPLSDGASKFRAFINDELFAEIESRYAVTNQRGIIGESAAGLFVVETLMLKPDMFNFYIAMDPALYWNDGYLLKTCAEHFATFGETERRLWFAGSNAIDISPHTQRLENILNTDAPASLTWKYSDEPEERHNSIFRATKERAIKWALSGGQPL